jgi:hypothetical protein
VETSHWPLMFAEIADPAGNGEFSGLKIK